MHPLLALAASQPQLLAEHAGGYAELLALEAGEFSQAWKRRLLLHALALGSALMGLTLAGVAALLWAVTPPAQIQAPWMLWAVPLLPLFGALGCLLVAQSGARGQSFDRLRQQLAADLQMLREAGAAP